MKDTQKRSNKPNVYLVAGFPGAGKSLLTKLGSGLLRASVVSMDRVYESLDGHERFLRYDDRVSETGLEAALREVRSGRNVMIDSCFKDPRERAEALRTLAPYADVCLIDITTPLEICRQRASRRPHPVDEEAYEFHRAVASPPDAGEGFAAIFPFDITFFLSASSPRLKESSQRKPRTGRVNCRIMSAIDTVLNLL